MRLSLQYIAGFYDGEGSVGVYGNRRNGFALTSQLAQLESEPSTNLFVELQSRWGGRVRSVTDNHRGQIRWAIHGKKAALFLHEIQPYLIIKAEQVHLALFWQDTRIIERSPKGTTAPKRLEQMAQDYEVCKRLREMKKQ